VRRGAGAAAPVALLEGVAAERQGRRLLRCLAYRPGRATRARQDRRRGIRREDRRDRAPGEDAQRRRRAASEVLVPRFAQAAEEAPQGRGRRLALSVQEI